jgi:5-methyltetrahydropteroyltriglutamate--homocysteine methyltransferase
VPVDQAALAARIASAVTETVAKQLDAGIDIINDGEMSKPSYATYIKDRLHGFGGESEPLRYADLVGFPEITKRLLADPGPARRKTPMSLFPFQLDAHDCIVVRALGSTAYKVVARRSTGTALLRTGKIS